MCPQKNFITTILAGSLPSGLTQISLVNNPIQTIDDAAFNELATTLNSLGISFAENSRIPDALLHLKVLTSLEIYDTGFIDWNTNVMRYIGSNLREFVLNNVSVATWPDWIRYFSHVTELSVVSCSITSIPEDALDVMASSLISLSLNNNSLTMIPRALSKLTALNMLFLQNNKITDISWLPQSSKLLSVSLNNNNIFNTSQLTKILQTHADTLSSIDLQNNKMTAIPDLHFLHVGSLDFSNNRISDPYSGSLPPDLYELMLGNNLLSSIPPIFSGLHSVTELIIPSNAISEIHSTDFTKTTELVELGYNQITKLSDTSFPTNSSIQILRLNNNPLMKISVVALQNLPQLTELNLQDTKLTRLPLGLSSLKKINLFDASGIQNLVCTCMEKSLEPWILSLLPEKVLGDCGKISIYVFFVTLSSSCPVQQDTFGF